MFVVVESVFFAGEDGEPVAVYGPYVSERDANLIVEQMRRIDRENGRAVSADYAALEVEAF